MEQCINIPKSKQTANRPKTTAKYASLLKELMVKKLNSYKYVYSM